jgi:hypothetical protein
LKIFSKIFTKLVDFYKKLYKIKENGDFISPFPFIVILVCEISLPLKEDNRYAS